MPSRIKLKMPPRRVSSVLRNSARSLGYLVSDVFREYNPVINELFESTKETSSDLYNSIKEFTADLNPGNKKLGKELNETTKAIFKNFVDDMKTGNWYNKARHDKVFNGLAMMGFDDSDFNLDFDSDDWGDGFDFDDEEEEGFEDDTKAILSENQKSTQQIVASMDKTGYAIASTVNQGQLQSAGMIVEAGAQNTQALYSLNQKGFTSVTEAILGLNKTIATIGQLGQPLTVHMQNASVFYTKTTQQLDTITQKLDELIKNTTVRSSGGNGSTRRTTFNDLLNDDVFDPRRYLDMLKENFKDDKDLLDMFKGGAKGINLKNISPGVLIGRFIMKGMIPKILKDTMTEFNTTLKYTINDLFLKGTYKLNDSPLGWLFGDYLTPKDTFGKLKTFRTDKYEKGPIQWDGVAKKALTEVIPTTLFKILSALTGTPEQRYDYSAGKFIKASTAKHKIADWKLQYGQQAGGELRKMLMSDIDKEFKGHQGAEYKRLKKEAEKFFIQRVLESDDPFLLAKLLSPKAGETFKDVDPKILNKLISILRGKGRTREEQLANQLENQRRLRSFNTIRFSARSAYNSRIDRESEDPLSILNSLYNGSRDSKANKHSKVSPILMDDFGRSIFDYLQAISDQLAMLGGGPDGGGKAQFYNPRTGKFGARRTGGRNTGEIKTRDRDNLKNQKLSPDYALEGALNRQEIRQAELEAVQNQSKSFKERFGEVRGKIAEHFKEKGFSIKSVMEIPAIGASKLLTSLSDAMTKVIIGDPENPESGLFGRIASKASEMFDTLKDKLHDLFDNKLKDTFEKLFGKKGEDGKRTGGFFSDLFNETKKSLKSGWDYAKNTAKNYLFGKYQERAAYYDEKIKRAKGHVADSERRIAELRSQINNRDAEAALQEANLLAEEDNGTAYAGRRITRSGLAVVSEGEMIIPASLNPYYTGHLGIRDRIRRESYIGNIYGIDSQYAKGRKVVSINSRRRRKNKRRQDIATDVALTGQQAVNGVANVIDNDAEIGKLEQIISSSKDSIKGFRRDKTDMFIDSARKGDAGLIGRLFLPLYEFAGNVKEANKAFAGDKKPKEISEAFSNLKEDLKKGKGNMGAGALIGLGAGALVGAPLLGAMVGTGIGFVKSSESAKNFLFGEIDEETGERKGGLFGKKFNELMKKNGVGFKNVGLGAGVGGVAGLFMGSPILGAIVGGSIGFVKSSDKAKNALFGKVIDEKTGERDASGILPKKLIDKFRKNKRLLPLLGAGAGIGALMGGPFGMVGGLMIGAGINHFNTSEDFRKKLFGDKETGEKGLLSDFKEKIIDKIKERLVNTGNAIMGWLKKTGRTLGDMLKKVVGGIGKKIGGFFAERLKNSKFGQRLLGLGRKVYEGAKGFFSRRSDRRIAKNLRKGYGVYTAKNGQLSSAQIAELLNDPDRSKNFLKYLGGNQAKKTILEKYQRMGSYNDEERNSRIGELNEFLENPDQYYDEYVKKHPDEKMSKRQLINDWMMERDQLRRDKKKEAGKDNTQRVQDAIKGATERIQKQSKDILDVLRDIRDFFLYRKRRKREDRLAKNGGLEGGFESSESGESIETTASEGSVYDNDGSSNTASSADNNEASDSSSEDETPKESIRDKFKRFKTKVKSFFSSSSSEESGSGSGSNTVSSIFGNMQMKRNEQGEVEEDTTDKETKQAVQRREEFNSSMKAIPKLAGEVSGIGMMFDKLKTSMLGDEKDQKKKGFFEWIKDTLGGFITKVGGFFTGIFGFFGKAIKFFKGMGGAIAGLAASVLGMTGALDWIGNTVGQMQTFKGNDTKGTLQDDTIYAVNGEVIKMDESGKLMESGDGGYITTDGNVVYGTPIDIGQKNSVHSQMWRNTAKRAVFSKGKDFGIFGRAFKKFDKKLGEWMLKHPNSKFVNFLNTNIPRVGRAAKTVGKGLLKVGKGIGKGVTRVGKAIGTGITKVGTKIAESSFGQAAKATLKKVTESTILKELPEKIMTGLQKISEALHKIPFFPKHVAKAFPNCVDDVAEGLIKASTKVGDKIAKNSVKIIPVLGQIIYVAGIVIAGIDAWGNAETTLGITERATTTQKVIATLLACVNNAIPVIGGLIPDKVIVNIFLSIADKLGLDVEDWKAQRQRAEEEVAAYNEEHGTNLDIEEYNKINGRVGEVTQFWMDTKGFFKNWKEKGFKAATEENMATKLQNVIFAERNKREAAELAVDEKVNKMLDMITESIRTLQFIPPEFADGIDASRSTLGPAISQFVKDRYGTDQRFGLTTKWLLMSFGTGNYIVMSKLSAGWSMAQKLLGLTSTPTDIQKLVAAVGFTVEGLCPKPGEGSKMNNDTLPNVDRWFEMFKKVASNFGVTPEQVSTNVNQEALSKIKGLATYKNEELEKYKNLKVQMTYNEGETTPTYSYVDRTKQTQTTPATAGSGSGLVRGRRLYGVSGGASAIGGAEGSMTKEVENLVSLAKNGNVKGLMTAGARTGDGTANLLHSIPTNVVKYALLPSSLMANVGKLLSAAMQRLSANDKETLFSWFSKEKEVGTDTIKLGDEATGVGDLFTLAKSGDVKDLMAYQPKAVSDTDNMGMKILKNIPVTAVKYSLLGTTLMTNMSKGTAKDLANIQNQVANSEDLLDSNNKDSLKAMNDGDVKGLFKGKTKGKKSKSDNPLSGILSGINAGYKLSLTPFALMKSAGSKISEGITKLVSPIVNDKAEFDKAMKKMVQYAKDGDTEKLKALTFTPSKGNPVGGLYKAGFSISKGFHTISASFHKIGNSIKEFFGIKSPDEDANQIANAADARSSGSGSRLISGASSGFVSQFDSANANKQMVGGNFASQGCGPAVASMISGMSVDQAISSSKRYQNDNGVDMRYFDDVLGSQGYSTRKLSGSGIGSQVMDNLRAGNKVILLGQDASNNSKSNSPFGPRSHYVLADGLDSNGNIVINDPELSGPTSYSPSILNSAHNATITSGAASAWPVKDTPIAQQVWAYFEKQGFSPAGIAGILGNMHHESGVFPQRIQGDMSQDGAPSVAYTNQVDSGAISGSDFVSNGPGGNGYGLVQFTYKPYKQALYDNAKAHNASIGNTAIQLDTLSNQIGGVMDRMKNATDPTSAASIFLREYEKPRQDLIPVTEPNRQQTAVDYYNMYSGKHFEYNASMTDNLPGSASTGSTTAGTAATAAVASTAGTTDSTTGEVNSDSSTNGLGILGTVISAFTNGFAKLLGGGDTTTTSENGTATDASGNPIGSTTAPGSDRITNGVFTLGSPSFPNGQPIDYMKSIEGKIAYSMNGPRNPDAGSADCSSTVNWAIKKAGGPDIGMNTAVQYENSNLTPVVYQNGQTISQIPEAAQPNDVMFFRRTSDYTAGRKDRVGHVGLYLGNNQYIDHGGPGAGPVVKQGPGKDLIKISRINMPGVGMSLNDPRYTAPKTGMSLNDPRYTAPKPGMALTDPRYTSAAGSGLLTYEDVMHMSGGASGQTGGRRARRAAKMLDGLSNEVIDRGASGSISTDVVTKLLKAIAKILEKIATNTGIADKIYTLLESYTGQSLSNQKAAAVTAAKADKRSKNAEKGTDKSFEDLIRSLSEIATG